jgi:vacuolar-type H+-ATPase subunit I/STV1
MELWSLPPDNSWIILAGIIGHAFLFSSLFVSTLFYYRGSINWMREIIKRNTRPTQLVNQ